VVKMSLAHHRWEAFGEQRRASDGCRRDACAGVHAVAARVNSYHRRLPMSLHALPGDVIPTPTKQVARSTGGYPVR
jgi:hypothetical protein